MSTLALFFIRAVSMGIGATFMFDLCGLFLKYAFKIPPSNLCLVGRWLRYMPDGVFKHTNIATVSPKSEECTLGWIAHYMIGITFAIVFLGLEGNPWLQHPTALPAMLFGVVTVVAPLWIMQPAFGFGFAASKTSNPAQARLRSLMNHLAFGLGIYIFGWMVALIN
jgi:hypothetical protein